MRGSYAHYLSPRPSWLCVAYAFPPINRSGTHRTLGFVKHLDRLGWDATVLTVTPREDWWDESLLREVPVSTEVLRTEWIDTGERIKSLLRLGRHDDAPRPTPGLGLHGSPGGLRSAAREDSRSSGLREWVSRLLMTPDSRIGWITPAVRAGLSAIRRRRPDVIYSTSPYMSAHLIALILSRWTRLPWVADFRDPWGGNPFRELGFRSVERLDALLEWAVLRWATRIVCSTPTMTQLLHRRRPFTTGKTATILNGFDRERYADIVPTRIAPNDHFVLAHAGQFYGPRSPRVWFAAFRRALDQMPRLAGKAHMLLLGSQEFEGRSLSEWASDAGVGDCVHVLGRKTHAETLSHLAGSDALMLAGSAGPGAELQVPNKLFEYIALRKPIIATSAAANPVVTILEEVRADALVCDPVSETALTTAITRFAKRRGARVGDTWGGVGQFERANRAMELERLFRQVSRKQPPATGRVLKEASMPARITLPNGTTSSQAGAVAFDDAFDH